MSIETLTIIAVALLALTVILCVAIYVRIGRAPPSNFLDIQTELKDLQEGFNRLDRLVRDEFSRGRDETNTSSKLLREEVVGSFGKLATDAALRATSFREEIQITVKNIADTIAVAVANLSAAQAEKLDAVTKQISALTEGNERRQEALRIGVESRLVELKNEAAINAKAQREEVALNLKNLGDGLVQGVNQLSEAQKERLAQVSAAVAELTQKTGEQQEALRVAVEASLEKVRTDNAEKLEQMRVTVDEKLQSTLETRLGASFKLVSDQLEQVFRGVGEMQALATGVGDLKKVLTNVRTRGTWGEVSLGNILDQVMASDQYERNVEVKPGSNQRVEYAIKLPGNGEGDDPVWLPIDAKYPTEDYERLIDASDRGDLEGVETASKAVENRIRASAKDICDKYVHPPHSTDFGVMFLPTEGLFAEIIRRPGLVDFLQRDCRIVVTGPTTLMALLNSLRMGFRTLAIQKRSSEVWQVLAAVKTEFGKYGEVLDKVQKKLNEASSSIDQVTVRRRAIDRKLRDVEVLPEMEASAILEIATGDSSEPS